MQYLSNNKHTKHIKHYVRNCSLGDWFVLYQMSRYLAIIIVGIFAFYYSSIVTALYCSKSIIVIAFNTVIACTFKRLIAHLFVYLLRVKLWRYFFVQEHEQSVLCWVHCASLPESEYCHLIIDSHFHFHFFTLTLNSHVSLSLSLPSFTPTWKVYSYVSLSLLSFTLTLKVHSYVSLSLSLVWTRWTRTHMWSVILRWTLTKPRLRRTQTILTKRTLVIVMLWSSLYYYHTNVTISSYYYHHLIKLFWWRGPW